jgi:hypothetical protein
MPTIEELLGNSGSKPPLGAQLAEGVRVLSADQTIQFDLYSKYVFALDGMVYWLKGSTGNVLSSAVTELPIGGSSYQIVDGNLNAQFITGGILQNPLTAIDQGLDVVEPLFYDLTGPADHHVSATTQELLPGEIFSIPANPGNGVWVNAISTGHKFSCVLNGPNEQSDLPLSVGIKGSLHYSAMTEQEEAATRTTNEIIFTSLSEVQLFNVVSPNQLYVATYRGIQFAFSARGPYYQQADLYHYVGKNLFSTHDYHLIEDPSTFVPDLLVSNSLPLWLNMNGYVSPYQGFQCPIRLYPSYLVNDNLEPPFCSVHIEETDSLGFPDFGPHYEQNQLCRDRVRITSYGANNNLMQTLLAFILQYSEDYSIIGMANIPVISDEKEPQPEFQILVSKKKITFEVNYYQSQVRNIVRKMIKNAVCYFYVSDVSVSPPVPIPV